MQLNPQIKLTLVERKGEYGCYRGIIPAAGNGEIRFCCQDSDVINVFKIEKEDLDDTTNN